MKISLKKLTKEMETRGWTFWCNDGARIKWYKKNSVWVYVSEYDPRHHCVYFWREA